MNHFGHRLRFSLLGLGLLASVLLCAFVSAAVPRATALGLDRSYEYRVSWNGIPAAWATVRMTEGAAPQSTTAMRAHIETNRFVDLFWSLRAESWGEADSATLRPQHFEFDRRIDGERELTRVEAEAAGQLTGRYTRRNRARLLTADGADVLDPVSAILRALRALPDADHPQTYDVFTGESRYRIVLRRDGSETISVPAGRFAAARIEPLIWRVDHNDRERRVRRLTLWVTEAQPHVLLRVRGEVFIGAIYCDLTAVSTGGATAGDARSIAEPHAQLQ